MTFGRVLCSVDKDDRRGSGTRVCLHTTRAEAIDSPDLARTDLYDDNNAMKSSLLVVSFESDSMLGA